MRALTSILRLVRWLRALLVWLAEPRLFWLTVLMLAFAFAFPVAAGMAEWQIRISGVFLQLLGLGTVAYGLRETRKLFERPSMGTLLRAWLARRPRWRRDVVMVAGTARSSSVESAARLHIWTPMNTEAPVAEQLKALTQNVDRLHEGLLEAQAELDKHQRDVANALRSEQQVRSQADTDLRKRLEAAQTGGVHISLAGLVWLLFGLLLGSFSSEIAQLAR